MQYIRNTRTDISRSACLPISLVIAVAEWLRLTAAMPGNLPYTTGQVMGHALFAVLVAAGLSRFARMRFRLTWVVTFAVVVLLIFLQSLVEKPRTETVSSGPLVLPALSLPAGWRVFNSTKLPGIDGVQETLALTQNDKRVAAITITLTRHKNGESLADAAKAVIEGESKASVKSGQAWAFLAPTQATWLGRPALQLDAFLRNETHVHQRTLLVSGSPAVACLVTYFAAEADFDQHLPALEGFKNQVTCPA